MVQAVAKLALVTGASGFLGRSVAETFRRAGFRVCGIGHGAAEADMDMWSQADVDCDSVSRLIETAGAPDVVVHAAGGSSVRAAHDAPFDDFQRTVAGTAGLLEALRIKAPAARLIMASSAAVYGNNHRGPICEDSGLEPISYYGAHKRMAEELCQAASRHWQLDVMIVRFFSLYGAGLKKQIFWDLAQRYQRASAKIELGGTGSETRDFLHVKDAARLLLLLTDAEQNQDSLVVNGGTGTAIPIRQAAEELARACGAQANTIFDGHKRPGDPAHLVADTARLERLGFKAEICLADGLAGFAEWHRELTSTQNAALNTAGASG